MIKKEWYKVIVPFVEDQKEIVNAFLIELEPDSLMESETAFEVFFRREINETLLSKIKSIPGVIGELSPSKCLDKNWNEVWESNYEPIEIDDFCQIRAEFHEANLKLPYQIIIRPQMAFGTGHHETTYMMIQALNRLMLLNKTVWDYGCGTSILSVFAAMKGASKIMCNDIETWAVENSLLHFELNGIDPSRFEIISGDISAIPFFKHDVILANINRRVLLESVQGIRSRLETGGTLLLSGVLDVDKDIVKEAYSSDFDLIHVNHKGEWICMEMQLKNS